MSSYFGGVSIGEGVIDTFNKYRAGRFVEAATYVGVAPEITTVLYAPGDRLGLASAMASLIPIGLCVALLTAFIARRTAEDLWVGGGQLVCEVLNGLVKLYIKEPRPSSPVSNMPVDSYGMPSAHSQYMGYFSTIVIIQALKARKISLGHRIARVLAILALSMFTAWSRYYLYYHTGPQVTVGFVVGSTFGALWFLTLYGLRATGVLDWGLELWPCRLLMVKDDAFSIAEEYEEWVQKRKSNNKLKAD